MLSDSSLAFLLRNSELFLILGTDGSDLRRLAESYDVSVEGVTRVPNGFALVLEGLRGSLDLLGLVLSQQKTVFEYCIDLILRTYHLIAHKMRRTAFNILTLLICPDTAAF